MRDVIQFAIDTRPRGPEDNVVAGLKTERTFESMSIVGCSPRWLNLALSSTTVAVLLAMFIGCRTAYNSNRLDFLANAQPEDFGQPPPSHHEEIERGLILGRLENPDDARFTFAPSKRDALPLRSASATPAPVWLCVVGVGTRKSLGRNAGEKHWQFAWQDGELVAAYLPSTCGSGFQWYYLEELRGIRQATESGTVAETKP